MNTQPLRSFRLVCSPDQALLVEALLHAQGFAFEPEPFYAQARRLVHEPFPLGSSLAAFFGYIYIQDRSSMLPPLALAPALGAAVLDMCASPGSKTSMLSVLVGKDGFVLGNEPSRNRLATLRHNLQTMNLFWSATTSHSGESLPWPTPSPVSTDESLNESAVAEQPTRPFPGWKYIQLDPPCSGWGTVEKNPQVMSLWQGDKVAPLIALQRKLLAEATRLLQPGGHVVYSTCTTNIQENEEQLQYACEDLGLEFLPLAPVPGFQFEEAALPAYNGCWRVATGGDGQGFFVGALRKPADAAWHDTVVPLAPTEQPCRNESEQKANAPESHGFFVRPWEKESAYVGIRRRNPKQQRSAASVAYLPREAIAGMGAGYCVDPTRLPSGVIGIFNNVAHFLPEQSKLLMPAGFPWKGFPLGKTSAQGQGQYKNAGHDGLRAHPFLRGLMPTIETAQANGITCMDIDDITPLMALITGQSLPVEAKSSEIGLYYRGLPLCRLTVKGKRAVLPPSL